MLLAGLPMQSYQNVEFSTTVMESPRSLGGSTQSQQATKQETKTAPASPKGKTNFRVEAACYQPDLTPG